MAISEAEAPAPVAQPRVVTSARPRVLAPAEPPAAASDARRPRRGLTVPRALFAADVLALGLALGTAAAWGQRVLGGASQLALGAVAIAIALAIARALGLYERDRRRVDHTTVEELFPLAQTIAVASWLALALGFAFGARVLAGGELVVIGALALALMFTLRVLARALCRELGAGSQRALVVGAGQIGHAIAQKLIRNPDLGLELVGFVDARPLERSEELSGVPVLGALEDIEQVVETYDVERVIVAFCSGRDTGMLALLRALAARGIQVDVVPRLFESVGLGASVHTLEGLPLIGLAAARPGRLVLACKRGADVLFGSLALFVLTPLLALIALAIKLDSPGSAFYFSERVGRGGRRFQLCKFRTMYSEACRGERYGGEAAEELFAKIMGDPAQEAEFQRTHKLRCDPRVTRLGALLRRTSLDELPQLVNVIVGELSLVGPRPVMAYEVSKLELINRGELERTADAITPSRALGYWELDWLRPGVTGYWQVTARSDVAYDERLYLDVVYMTSWSLKLDLLIVLRTLGVLAGRGAY